MKTPDLETAKLVPQTYGIATAGPVFGGPRGIWLECKACRASDKIAGSGGEGWGAVSDADTSAVFRRFGWTGEGDRMTNARCPKCSAPKPVAVEWVELHSYNQVEVLFARHDGFPFKVEELSKKVAARGLPSSVRCVAFRMSDGGRVVVRANPKAYAVSK